ncbi:MAG: XRE family transcriptional regulator [Actinomycetia bacterium]|nr:XRE family transcriptional regulator [Actinomycetes bacterium]
MTDDPGELDLRVARRLADLREKRGLTLSTLAEQTGISTAHLSRLEKGARLPSVGTLLQLARAYGVSIGELVEETGDDDYSIVRAADAPTYAGADGLYRVLSGAEDSLSVMEVSVPAGKRTKAVRHPGEEWLHVQTGTVQLVIDTAHIDLDRGDSVHFDSAVPHRLVNTSHSVAVVLVASTSAQAQRHHPTS